eukprot:2664499-Amphidinium_carterae.1
MVLPEVKVWYSALSTTPKLVENRPRKPNLTTVEIQELVVTGPNVGGWKGPLLAIFKDLVNAHITPKTVCYGWTRSFFHVMLEAQPWAYYAPFGPFPG